MISCELVAELRFEWVASRSPVVERRGCELDHCARLGLVGDEQVAFSEVPRHVAQLLNSLNSRFGEVQDITKPRKLAQLGTNEFGLGVLQDRETYGVR